MQRLPGKMTAMIIHKDVLISIRNFYIHVHNKNENTFLMEDVDKYTNKILLNVIHNFESLYKRVPTLQKHKDKCYKEAIYPTNKPVWYFEYKDTNEGDFEIFEAIPRSQMHDSLYIQFAANFLNE